MPRYVVQRPSDQITLVRVGRQHTGLQPEHLRTSRDREAIRRGWPGEIANGRSVMA